MVKLPPTLMTLGFHSLVNSPSCPPPHPYPKDRNTNGPSLLLAVHCYHHDTCSSVKGEERRWKHVSIWFSIKSHQKVWPAVNHTSCCGLKLRKTRPYIILLRVLPSSPVTEGMEMTTAESALCFSYINA